MKRVLKVAGISVLVTVLAIGGFFGWFFSHIPKRGPDRIQAAEGVVGVFADASYAWIIRTRNGAALIDAGLDPKAAAILAELRAQGLDASRVHTILLTHGHGDHYAGAIAFPAAKVWIGAADEPLATGARQPQAFGPQVFDKFGKRAAPAKFEHLSDGALAADDASIEVVMTPGHTPGSAMFVYKGVLFTGDSLFGSAQGVALPPDLFEEDAAMNRRSLARLAGVSFTRIADGHTGVVEDAKPKLAALGP